VSLSLRHVSSAPSFESFDLPGFRRDKGLSRKEVATYGYRPKGKRWMFDPNQCCVDNTTGFMLLPKIKEGVLANLCWTFIVSCAESRA
jgi:hypothetical protein